MRVLVTGGAGFVGSHTAKRLVEEGHEVTITSTGAEHEIAGVKKVLYASLCGIDLESLKDLDAVIHLAANNDTLCRDEAEMIRANLAHPTLLFQETYRFGCRRFVYASSTAVYGNSPAPYAEDETPVNPLNPYAASKLAFERRMEESFYPERTDVSVIGLRYCNVYGPGEEYKGRRQSMIGQLIPKMIRGETPRLFEFGEQKRDWIYVEDVVQANMRALEATEDPKLRVYNVGSGVATTFNNLIAAVNEAGGTNLAPVYMPCPFADSYQSHTECNIERASRELGFSPRFDIRSGVRSYYDHFLGRLRLSYSVNVE